MSVEAKKSSPKREPDSVPSRVSLEPSQIIQLRRADGDEFARLVTPWVYPDSLISSTKKI